MNTATFVGRLVYEPVAKKVQSNGKETAVLNGTLAVAKKNKKEQATYIPFVAWGKEAENLEKYNEKGYLVSMTGHMDSTGEKTDDGWKNILTLVVRDIHYLEPMYKVNKSKSNEEEDAKDE